MFNRKVWHITAIGVVAVLLFTLTTALVGAQSEGVRSTAVTGELAQWPATHYLGLEITVPGESLVIEMTFEPQDQDINFYILNQDGLRRVQSGERPERVNIAAGNPVKEAPVKTLRAQIIKAGAGPYTVIVLNNARVSVTYNLTVTNGIFVDRSGQVTDARAPVSVETVEKEAVQPVAAAPAATATPTPSAVVAETGAVTAQEMEGYLGTQYETHYLYLNPTERDVQVVVTMEFNPADARNVGFFVQQKQDFVLGRNPVRINLGAGEVESKGPDNRLVARFKAYGFSTYVVLVYNNSRTPVDYTIQAEKAMLTDDAGQTETAQQAQAAPAAGAAPAAPAAAEAAVTPITKVGEVYVVVRGDTLGSIAKAAYGEVRFYKSLCAYNGIANCDRIEVGDKITLPPKEELASGVTAPAATPTPTTAAAAAATPPTTATVAPTPAAGAPAANNIIDTLTNAKQFEILLLVLDAAGLTDTLKSGGPYTVFAPDDASFAAFITQKIPNFDALLDDPVALAQLMSYHIVPNKLLSTDLAGTKEVATLQGPKLTIVGGVDGTITISNTITLADGTKAKNNARVATADLNAANGVIHTIDTVLVPPDFTGGFTGSSSGGN